MICQSSQTTSLIEIGEPKYYILRLGCSSLNYDLFNNYVSDTCLCMCGSQETAKHFLIDCDTFNDIRNTTINTLAVAFDVDILLKGCPL